jgi:hypothetical protein
MAFPGSVGRVAVSPGRVSLGLLPAHGLCLPVRIRQVPERPPAASPLIARRFRC